LADCNWHTTEIIWNANTHTYTASFDGVLVLTYTGNIVANFFGGNPVVNWGWSGSTGGGYNTQQVCMQSISNTTGISAAAEGPDLQISPNPNQGNFTVAISSATMLSGTLTVEDQLGRAIYTQNIGVTGFKEVPLELGNVSPGVYLLVMDAGGARSVQRFIVK
jgi:hypothetical protein